MRKVMALAAVWAAFVILAVGWFLYDEKLEEKGRAKANVNYARDILRKAAMADTTGGRHVIPDIHTELMPAPSDIRPVDAPWQKVSPWLEGIHGGNPEEYVSPQVFFTEFDKNTMIFVIGRVREDIVWGRDRATYNVVKIYRVKRSKESEKALHVDRQIAQYETGLFGIQPGMSHARVIEILGAPERTAHEGIIGEESLWYPKCTVRLFEGKVYCVEPF